MSAMEDVPGGTAREITLIFDQATVDLDALQRSAYAVAADMTVDIRVSGTDYVCVLFPRRPGADDEPKHRFRAEVNDQILRSRIAKETEPLRTLVFALAFSQTGLADAGDEGEHGAEELPASEVTM
jgi:His-Xaa-Ser system protein HxsD